MLRKFKKIIKRTGAKIIYQFLDPISLTKIVNDTNDRMIISNCECQTICGEKSKFYPEAKVYNSQSKDKIVIGKNTHIRGQLLILKYGGSIKIGDNCYIGDGTRIWSGESIIIGDNVLISHNVSIIDTNSHEMDFLERAERYIDLISNGPWDSKGSIITSPITINDYVWVSFGATILKGVTIGKGAIVAAGAVVTKNVEPWTVVAGNPAVVVKYLPEYNKKK
jgi:acetyltransferase-like isoleucine patch superfamily enzyme